MDDLILPCIKEVPFNDLKAYHHPELRLCGVYAICIKDTGGSGDGFFYVGSTTTTFSERIVDHRRRLRRGIHHTYRLQQIFNKYGESYFYAWIVEPINTKDLSLTGLKDLAINREQYWIDSIGFNNLLNECPVASSTAGRKYSLEEKNNRKESRKRFVLNSEALKRFSAASKERWSDPSYRIQMKRVHKDCRQKEGYDETRKQIGATLSKKIKDNPEMLEIRRQTFKKNWQNPDCRERMTAKIKERTQTPSSRQIISESTKRCWKDEKHSKERTLNIVKGLASEKTPCILIALDSTVYVTDNVSGLCRMFSLNITSVCRMLKGRQFTSQGWTGYKLASWADVPNDAIRILWGDHPDLPPQTQIEQPVTPIQLSLDI
jgi:hypothetical protein